MAYSILYADQVEKDLKKIDRSMARQIISAIDTNLSEHPHHFGKKLKGRFKGLFRYRIGKYRVIYSIVEKKVFVLVLRIGHRKDVYE